MMGLPQRTLLVTTEIKCGEADVANGKFLGCCGLLVSDVIQCREFVEGIALGDVLGCRVG